MKKSNGVNKQRGFFDFGLALAVLALTGAFAVATTPDEDDKVTAQDPQIEVVANMEAGSVEFQD